MLLADLNQPATYQPLLSSHLWPQIFTALPNIQTQPVGEYAIQDKDIFAMVQEVATIPRSQGVFEAHDQYIDLHLCLKGSERIEWTPVFTLTDIIETNPDNDVTLFKAPDETNSIILRPNRFAIFLPDDAHMPKIINQPDPTTTKIVVKIKADLLKP